MTDNRSSEVAERIVKGLALNPGFDKIPERIAESIVPTFQSNIPVPKIREIVDVALNDSDKTITVPVGKMWKILYGTVILVTTATINNRLLELRIQNSLGNFLQRIEALNVQAPSATEYYNFGQYGDISESQAALHLIPIPDNLFLVEGQVIRILDINAIDVGGDDLDIRFIVEEYDYIMKN